MRTALFHTDSGGSRSQPWVYKLCARPFEIFNIPSDDSEASNQSRRSDQPIDIRQLVSRAHSSPNLSFLATDPKNSSFKNRRHFRQRSLIPRSFHRILSPDLLHASAHFSHGQHTHEVGLGSVILEPNSHLRIRPDTLLHLANHVGVDEEHTRRIQSINRPWSRRGGRALRGSFRSNIQSSPVSVSPTSFISKRLLVTDSFAFLSASTIASAKIRRCSSSADTPCAAARSFRDFTNSSGIFLTNN